MAFVAMFRQQVWQQYQSGQQHGGDAQQQQQGAAFGLPESRHHGDFG
ncbi:hypothetical protein HX893_06185 [Pseudomonas reactans]|uniref:Uncharacterized protein n=1 Tax=Pseudomonas reactans TaxID=117680 RepID=A0A7Y8FY74_9PSED|nr:hypothetical protein [Pseudomonas reactans]NWD79283.1 hypothetical protein [Pseudomonas reactans]NWE87721.1 hypothetical protein [Pseudomonas reactans]